MASKSAILFGTLFLIAAQAAPLVSNRYALILEDPPASASYTTKEAMQSAEARVYQRQIQARQTALRTELAAKNFRVTGSVNTLLNAIFVIAPPERVAELQNLPGVKGVVPLRWHHPNLNRATQVLNAPSAWNSLGGIQNAGTGIKIAILDTGIDQTHPAFQDSTLPMPAGYPICNGSDCAFTNNKVIVARSYVRQIAAGSSSSNPAADSRPDDYSPRDRVGHGTATASCAAGNTNSGLLTIMGMAPKAYLGNYKITGSPEVNDSAPDDAIIQALEDAMHDGMDIVSFSFGAPAFSGALDTGAACGNAPGVPCDPSALAFENAAKAGMIIVAAAGNDGASGNNYPTFNSISTPGAAPSVLAVGATSNSHMFAETLNVPGQANLQNLTTDPGDSLVPSGSVTAPVRDVTTLGDNGLACSALPAQSLIGYFALIERGSCQFATKAANAQNAGALGVILYMADSSTLVSPSGLSSLGIPVVMVANSDGVNLKNFVAQNPTHGATIDGAGIEQAAPNPNQLLGFSSFGPSTGDSLIKPDLVAVGGNENVTGSVYMAAESYDPLGVLYSSDGYAAADGTSFATPLVAGAAALVKQKNPKFTANQIRSALVNTASQNILTDDTGNAVNVQWLGAGQVDAGAAASAIVTSNPWSISFGPLTSSSLPASRQLSLTNTGASMVNLALSIAPTSSSSATVSVTPTTLSLAAGATSTATVTVAGSNPSSGSYSGAVVIQGSGASLRVPYMYLVPDGIPGNMIPLSGTNFDGTVGGGIPDGILAFKLVDDFGVPIAGAPVSWTSRGGGTLISPDSATDVYGIAAAQPVLASVPGNQSYTAVAGGMRTTFSGFARFQPAITSVENAASLQAGTAIAPGSYIAIFGTGLSDVTDYAETARLPLAVDFVTVSFDVPSANISVPGHLTYVSASQINVQVPWELQGQTSALVKVTIDYSNGNVVTLPVSNYAPAFFEVGSGVVAALDANYALIGSTNPARRGQFIQLYANGLGPVSNQPASGDPALAAPLLSQTTTKPIVMIGGQSADVSFSGLAPGFAGLYQINVTVPSNLTPGNNTLTVAIGGQTSKTTGISVQ